MKITTIAELESDDLLFDEKFLSVLDRMGNTVEAEILKDTPYAVYKGDLVKQPGKTPKRKKSKDIFVASHETSLTDRRWVTRYRVLKGGEVEEVTIVTNETLGRGKVTRMDRVLTTKKDLQGVKKALLNDEYRKSSETEFENVYLDFMRECDLKH